jgi:hypothetical protein
MDEWHLSLSYGYAPAIVALDFERHALFPAERFEPVFLYEMKP